MIKRLIFAWLLLCVGITCLKVHADDLSLLGVSNSKTVSGATTAFDTSGSGSNNGGAISCDGTRALSSCVKDGSSNGFSGTYTPAGAATCIVALLQLNQGSITAITYGGTNMTSAGSAVAVPGHSGAITANIYYLAISTGATAETVFYDIGTGGFSSLSILSFTGTGSNCFRAGSYATATTTSGASVSTTVTSATGDIVADIAVPDAVAMSPGSGQTQRGNGTPEVSTKTGGSSVTMCWSSDGTCSTGTSQNIAQAAISVQHQ